MFMIYVHEFKRSHRKKCVINYVQKKYVLSWIFQLNFDVIIWFITYEAHVIDVFAQTVDGVQFLHSNKIIHRDIKPENILLTIKKRADGELLLVKIADFGLATQVEHSLAMAQTQCGTFFYQAPEVCWVCNYY